jgi:Rrf2 family protein
MLSKKTRYAMIALVKLAREYGKGTVLISEIAQSENIPQRFLENILLELKKLGILGSKLGKSGGYYLLKKPKEVNLATIINHFEGTIALLPCVSEKSYLPCEIGHDEESCKIKKVFKKIRNNTFQILDKTTLDKLI